MKIQFTKKGKSIRVDGYEQLNLLGHAQLEEMDIGSQCGGHGVCGRDRIQIAASDQVHVSPVNDIERLHLTAEEIALGFRLGCQCWPRGYWDGELKVEVI